MASFSFPLVLRLILAFYTALSAAVSQELLVAEKLPAYSLGDAIPVSCLNRTV